MHHHQRGVESQVAQQEVEATRQRPAQAARSPRHDAADVLVDFRQEVAALEPRLVVQVLGEGLEGDSQLVLADDPIQIAQGGGCSLHLEMGKQAIGGGAHGRFSGGWGTPAHYPNRPVSFC
jgi:hypothetical protein